MNSNSALLIIDYQNDFLENGTLPIWEASQILTPINNLILKAKQKNYFVLATKEFHPETHISFKINKSLYEDKFLSSYLQYQDNNFWPKHCVQFTNGSEFVEGLDAKNIDKVFYKGTDTLIDSYSIFYSNHHLVKNFFFENYLKEHNIKTLYLCGVALDYCVLYTALDAVKLGYEVYLILDATKPVDKNRIEWTLQKYQQANIKIIFSAEF